MDPCRSTVSYDREIAWRVNIDFERSICFCGHRFQKMKLFAFDRFRCRADAVDYIWPCVVPNISDFCDISNRIHKYKYTVRCTSPTKKKIGIQNKIDERSNGADMIMIEKKHYLRVRCKIPRFYSMFT